MGDVFRKGGFTADTRTRLADDQAVGAGAFFVSKARFLAEREVLLARGGDLGLVLEPSDRLDDIVADLPAIGAIAVHFPKFGDGRGYSLARLLRDRHGFSGELRAFGDILWDQVEALSRVGFDALEVTHEPTRARLAQGLPSFAVRYQPTGSAGLAPIAGRPWATHG
jgi:phosphoadenosine phosphosulfate reductase